MSAETVLLLVAAGDEPETAARRSCAGTAATGPAGLFAVPPDDGARR